MSPALVVFTSCQNSYPFQERHVYLREPVKIGRAVARSPPAKNNAIFDCKVLSRNHALLWFDHNSGKFYLQDTGSSNGTFINSTRLSHAHQHGPPSQIFTGDIIQFGVDVTESSCNVTHGCVVSSICLFLPDGVEASHRAEEDATPPEASPATSPLPVWKVAESTPSVYSLELFQLSQYLKEALQREQMLEQKLVTLQWLLGRTQEASEASFQAVVDEDQLLSRLEVMENMLQALSGNQCEGRVLELAAYQSTAKEALRRVLREKVEVCQTLSKVELSLSSAQDTCLHLQHLRERAEQELTELASKYSKAVSIIQGLTHTIKLAESQQEKQLQKHLQEKMELQLLIQSLEEQEQEPQTNSDTKECLQSVQGCLEQHQHKITKSHFLASPFSGLLQCLMDEKTLTKEWFLPPPSESLMDASGWTVSGTLSSVEDCTMHSTGRMEEKKDTEAVNNVTLLTEDCGSGELQSREAELQSRGVELQSREAKLQSREAELHSREVELRSREAELQSGEAEHVARLNSQLHEAQDQASSSQSRCVELQDVLEKERREAQLHSQESANQIQALQAQVQKLQEEVQVLCAERACVVSRAQEEVLLLQGAVEASASERKKERTALQESLAAVTAELDRGRRRAAECEQESSSLKARLQELQLQSAQAAQLQGELQKNCFVLQTECAALCSEKTALQENMQHLEKDLHSSRDQAALLGRSVSALERTQGELESRLAEQQEQRQQDRARLKAQLDQATARIKGLQREYEDTQVELVQVKQRCSEVEQEKLSLSEELHQCKDSLKQLQERYEDTQVELVQVKQRCSEVEQEKLSLSEELDQCKDSLKQLQERASRPSLHPVLAMLVGVVLAVLFWGYSSLW